MADQLQNVRNDEQELLDRVAVGDVFAFSALVERFSEPVYGLAHRMLLDRAESEDVAQEAFTRLWQGSLSARRPSRNVRAWLMRVVANLCLDRLRKLGPIFVAEYPPILDEAPLPDEIMEGEQRDDVIRECFSKLSPSHRTALVLTYFEEYSNREAAEMIGVGLKAFESILVRARKRMALLLTERDYNRTDTEESVIL